jgi:hypothetical protein
MLHLINRFDGRAERKQRLCESSRPLSTGASTHLPSAIFRRAATGKSFAASDAQ